MARAWTKCAICLDVIYFESDSIPPQRVTCVCGESELTESGPIGNFIDPTVDEIGEITFGIQRVDLKEMRSIFTGLGINRPRHCFRWDNSLSRWELSEVAPVNRTLIAYRAPNLTWVNI